MNKPSLPLALGVLAALALVVFGVFLAQLLAHKPSPDASTAVLVWWAGLCAVALYNIAAWAIVQPGSPIGPDDHRHWQKWLSLVFVMGCAFRSFLPRADVQRICLVDSWLSTVLIGRAVATVAELCFMAQWSLLLREHADTLNAPVARTISRLILPFIGVAEVCSWYAVITTNYIGNVIEQSIWAITATMTALGAISMWPRATAPDRKLLLGTLLFGLAFVAFLCSVDVPMYVSRWLAEEASGRPYFSFSQGMHDLATRWVVTYTWEDWRQELAWMALYFSAAVWSSIALMHAPRPAASRRA